MDEDLKKLLQQNLEYSKDIHATVKKIRKHLVIEQVFGVIKVLIIVVPLVLAIIYALPFMKQMLETYKNIDNMVGGLGKSSFPSAIPQDLLKQFLK